MPIQSNHTLHNVMRYGLKSLVRGKIPYLAEAIY